MENIKLAVAFHDQRGDIVDLIQNENINAVTIITITKGAVRGNHFHKQTFQWNYIMSGKMKLVTQHPGAAVEELTMEKGDFALTVPNESHALVGLEECEVLVLTKGPRGGKEYESDTFRLATPLA